MGEMQAVASWVTRSADKTDTVKEDEEPRLVTTVLQAFEGVDLGKGLG